MDVLAHKLPREAQRLYALTNRAHEIVTGNLTRFGNILSQAHSEALFALVGGFSALALGLRQRAYPETSERVALLRSPPRPVGFRERHARCAQRSEVEPRRVLRFD